MPRKPVLLVHILSSVGWLGAVAAFLALAITGLTHPVVYAAMDPITWPVIVPLAITSLATGLLLSLGTRWGLFRHYWIIVKFGISLVSLPLLVLHTRMIHRVATAATPLHGDRIHLVIASAASLTALITATLLSVYKPKGMLS
ncbi:hypothetical protein [Dinghuibacter silviterrae]|uniref:DUF2269 domain-containing protein n=1 Tax=Dinghuibacter silviterrae TaxID=1539049 RepID=A0A4R8DMV4_9BACT|nr:hypothetical protein [Dinghuibacter silviterrae]TDW99108.1 hypothetical protein EDB95_0116 [Dinghuibacter silviterrae]